MKLGQLARQYWRTPGTILSTLLLVVSMLGSSVSVAQSEVFRARLSPMPTTTRTVNDITGEGEVMLTLNGNSLVVAGTFAGMSSNATAVHIHNGPPAQPGPVIHTLTVTQQTAGEISGELTLSDEQVAELKANRFYLQVHSENNPPGELRGWVFLQSHFQ